MAFEIPYDQIRELQISLRKEAGFASYNPDVSELPDLPSLKDAISELDPSPAYLRCKHCKGRLLRGINSGICVFCGRQQNKDAPPDPIKFTSTFGCRWFLQSLDLDGSELVAPSIEANESNRGQNTPEIEFPLSDLLDLEIRWPTEPERFETGFVEKNPARHLSTLNFSGVNLNNSFTEAKVDSVSAATEEHFAVNKTEDATGSNVSEGHRNLNLFENVQPFETVAAMSKEDESSNSFSGWEADFQSASSGTQLQKPNLSDPFVGSSSIDLSSHMDAVFGSGKDLFNEKTKENITTASNRNDWFEGDLWSNPNAGVAVRHDEILVPMNDKDHRIIENTVTSSSTSIDWIQDSQWQTATSSSKATDNRTIDEEDDTFDAWNEFTSSSSVQVAYSNTLQQDVNRAVSSVERASESLFSGTDNSKDVDFDSFSQPDFFSATSNNQNGSAEVSTMVPDSVSDSIASMKEREEGSSEEVVNIGKVSNENAKSIFDAETLMSQMHDLSFMLARDLSIPEKKDPQKTDPFNSFSKD
ncbi:hypothetical protein JCGZ_13717 [Jatropha curcas]|uniref:DUF7815 domain-containing protein n=1 Tax=Jatropha curcas TaxID=180498 RepID=A0A067KG28_JATCU|nr:uncharacterized protein LOC105640827 [Jatropha curcas]KDP30774.1 hypothetical protein JCGZ_13717 [Jatropha curcas]